MFMAKKIVFMEEKCMFMNRCLTLNTQFKKKTIFFHVICVTLVLKTKKVLIRRHIENCVIHDRKEPILDSKSYVHEKKRIFMK